MHGAYILETVGSSPTSSTTKINTPSIKERYKMENTDNGKLTTEETASVDPKVKTSGNFIQDFKVDVKALLLDAGTKTRNFLIEEEAEAILQTYKMAAKRAYQTLFTAQKELKKLLPDDERYDADGKLVSATYTKNQAKKIVDLKREISDTETMLKNALDKGDFDKLVEKYGKA